MIVLGTHRPAADTVCRLRTISALPPRVTGSPDVCQARQLATSPNDLPRCVARIHVERRPQLEVVAEVELFRRKAGASEWPVHRESAGFAFEHVELQALPMDAIR